MARRAIFASLAIVALQAAVMLLLGPSKWGSFLGNSLQAVAAGLAGAMALFAAKRGRGLSRSIWILVGCGWAAWALSNAGWMFQELALGSVPAPLSLVRFLFDMQGALFAMALFLDEERDSSRLDVAALLDFLQITIVYFLIYLVVYYVPLLSMTPREAMLRQRELMLFQDGGLLILSIVRAGIARSNESRALYLRLSAFLAAYTVLAQLAEYAQYLRERPAGTILDFAWTLPFLGGAIWAGGWKPSGESVTARLRAKSIGGMLFWNAMFALGPLIVLFMSTQLGPGWKPVRLTVLGISILCYGTRMALNERRQARNVELVNRQMEAMESSVDGMAIVDGQGVYVYVNSEYARMCGLESPQKMIGKSWQQLAYTDDREQSEAEIREALAKRGRWFGQLTLNRGTDHALPIEMAVTAMSGGGVVCVSRDLTERRRVEQAKAEAESKYQMIVEKVAAISYIAELGLSGSWRYVSPQIENILGYTQEEWLADSAKWVRHVHPDDIAAVEEAETACLVGRAFQAEYRLMRKDGRIIWVSDSAVVVQGAEGTPLMEGIIVDITERKQLENQLQQSRRMEAV
ncbi:MAG TPA: PAS domain S-box protein, partial [Candidatus Acidoferrum sp.]|nr:PAS domain S-box protein [Candidatus Acidoferrum sp.]